MTLAIPQKSHFRSQLLQFPSSSLEVFLGKLQQRVLALGPLPPRTAEWTLGSCVWSEPLQSLMVMRGVHQHRPDLWIPDPFISPRLFFTSLLPYALCFFYKANNELFIKKKYFPSQQLSLVHILASHNLTYSQLWCESMIICLESYSHSICNSITSLFYLYCY